MRTFFVIAILASSHTLQAQVNRDINQSNRSPINLSRFSFGVSMQHAVSQGALGVSAGSGTGPAAYVRYALNSRGTIALRAELSSLDHSASQTSFFCPRCFGELDYLSIAGGPPNVVTRSNTSIAGLGAEMGKSIGPFRPYVTASFNRVRFESESQLDSDIFNPTGAIYAAATSDVSYAWAAGAGTSLALDAKTLALIELSARYISGAKASFFHDGNMRAVGSNSYEMAPARDDVRFFAISLGLRIDLNRLLQR